MTKTEVHEDLLEELRNLDQKPATNPPDPEIYNAAIAKGVTPDRAALLALAATNPSLDVTGKTTHRGTWTDRLRKKTRKGSTEQPRPWITFLGRTFAGAFFGLMVGAGIMFLVLIVALLGWVSVTNGDMVTTILLIATTLVGAGLGYASAAKHLRSSDEEPHVTPTPKTA